MKKKKYVFAILIILFVCIVGAGFGLNAVATIDDNIICDGVYIDSIDISGMTVAEAKSAVDSYVEQLKSKTITIMVDDNKVTTSFEELGYNMIENDYIDQALKVGKSGNLIKRYTELKDIEREKLVFKLEFSVDDAIIKNLVENDCSSFNIPSKNATIRRENGNFIVTNEEIGRKVVIDETIEKIKSSMLKDWNQNDLKLDAIVINDEPEFTKEIVEKCNTVLATYTTTYASSSASRAANLANGAKLLNGTVLYPQEILSCYEVLNPFTVDNGYYTAGAYSQGKVIDSIGGGICQVSSTLYNASILAELEIVERSPHSMSVSYVPLSRDAAIAGTYKDLKVKNNTDAPIYIEAFTVGRAITFKIYGNETRNPGRKIEFETVVTKKINPPKDVITKDATKPASYEKVTQSAHIGYKAELYKVIYQDGVIESRTLFNSSSYAAAPRYVTVGTKEEVKETEKNEEDDKNKKLDNTDSKKNNTNKKDSKTNSTKVDSSKIQSSDQKVDLVDKGDDITNDKVGTPTDSPNSDD